MSTRTDSFVGEVAAVQRCILATGMPADRCNCDAPSSVNEGLGELDEPCGGDEYMPRFEGLAGALLPYCVGHKHIKGS